MSLLEAAKRMDMQHNVWFRVIDPRTREVVQQVAGHNAATNSMLTGIAHYLVGDGILNQGYDMLSQWVPRYMSLGTMGLYSQEADENGLPIGIGTDGASTEDNVNQYLHQVPGYGADGYDPNENNGREFDGLGPMYDSTVGAINCELISASFPRAAITYREILPETRSELPHTIDVVYSALVSTGALAQFRGEADHVFITEAGLWSRPTWTSGGDNGLLAGYRMVPRDLADMTPEQKYRAIQENILRVGINQVVQVIWKIQLGGIDQLVGSDWPPFDEDFYWHFWDEHSNSITNNVLNGGE